MNETGAAPAAEYGAAALDLGITRDLAVFLAAVEHDHLPAEAVHCARRGVLDWLGCALAASRDPTIDKVAAVLQAAGGRAQAAVIGRGTRLGLLDAPVVNGQMGHLLDFDDTHMGGVILHTSSPVLAALLALAERAGETVDGARLIAAYAVGFEAGVRAGRAAPGHHRGGWHLTGTLGAIAAGAACARLLGLDTRGMVHALGIATTQASGMQQNRGTPCKSFHAGKAAHAGVLAALLAAQGFDSSEEILEGKRGFCRIYSDVAEPERILEGLGESWEITRNGHKPYACGVVLHPAIDVMAELGRRAGAGPAAAAAERVERVELVVNPAAVVITGVADPRTGLQSKFSIYHSAAVAYLDGTAGVAQYSDARAAAPEVIALRGRIRVTTDEGLARDQARATVTLRDGVRQEARVEHATGTVDNPMPDAALEAKFMANASPALGEARAADLRDRVWRLDEETDLRELIALAAGL